MIPAYKLLLISILIFISAYSQRAQDDEVVTGIPGYTHRIYSGYLDISFGNLKSIHYVYYQSQRDVTKDPVVVWLSGGPGCSSLMAMLQQNGPLIIPPGSSKASLNPNAWNKRANLVYIEGPAGVGFSSREKDDVLNDEDAANQFLAALGQFLDRHSRLKKSQLYIAGSGYGAIFATYLAKHIILNNKDPALITWDTINLKGVLLGNPCVNPDQCFASGSQRNSVYHYQFLYNRGFITKRIYFQFLGKCSIIIDPYPCYQARQLIDKNIMATNTSAYNIYSKCYYNKKSEDNTINLGCQDQTGAIQYLNDPTFQKNWNIKQKSEWAPCSLKIWNQYYNGNGSIHLIQMLINQGMRVWTYSGDMDSTVPITGTKAWINYLRAVRQIPIKKNWRQWWVPGKHKFQDQVGGFIWELEGLTFVSVKGAGFKASYDQPIAMEQVLNGFLDGKTLPKKTQ